jgi:hypothetical protein
MSFEIEVLNRLDKIEATLSVMRYGEFIGRSPKQSTVVINPADVAYTLTLLGDMGTYGPDPEMIERWLREGHSPDAIVKAVRDTLGDFAPNRPLSEAAQLLMAGHVGGWALVTNKLAGKEFGPFVNPDPGSNLLAGLSNVNGPADLETIVPEVIARAENGQRWNGSVGLAGADLEDAKRRLVSDRLPEWSGWKSEELLRVVVLGNVIARKRVNPFGAYDDVSVLKTQTVAEWLYEQKLATPGGNPA